MKAVHVLAGLCLGLVAAQAWGAINVEADRFTGTTKIQTDMKSLSHWGNGPDIIWHASVKGHALEEAGIVIAFSHRDWQYLQCHDVKWLVDGEPLQTADADQDGQVQTGYVQEFVSMPLTLPQIAKFMVAKKVEFRVCNDEFAFDSAQIADMQQFGLDLSEAVKPAGH